MREWSASYKKSVSGED